MMSHPVESPSAKNSLKVTAAHAAMGVAYAAFVAGGARGALGLTGSMMSGVALLGAWLMLTLGLAYAAVRLRPKVGGALLIGFGVGMIMIALAAGMFMLS